MSRAQFHVVLAGAFLLEAAGYLAFPYLALGLRDRFSFVETQIGLIFLVATGLRPVWAILGGTLAEKIRPVYLFAAACTAEGIAFSLLGTSLQPTVGIAAIILGNLGFSLWTPNLFALVYQCFEGKEATAKTSLLNGVLNAGAAVGCLVGASVVVFDMSRVFLGAALLYFIAMPVLARVLAPLKTEARKMDSERESDVAAPPIAWLGLILTTLGFWASYAQFNSYFALFAKDWLGKDSYTGIAFAVLAISVAFLSVVLSKSPRLQARLLGLTAMSAAILLVTWQLLAFAPFPLVALVFVLALATAEAFFSVHLVEGWGALNRRRNHLMQSLNFAARNVAMGLGSFVGGYVYVPKSAGTGLTLWASENSLFLVAAGIGLSLSSARRRIENTPLVEATK